jgi:hypothetical protein
MLKTRQQHHPQDGVSRRNEDDAQILSYGGNASSTNKESNGNFKLIIVGAGFDQTTD